jgi:hypothetical protein
MGQTTASPRDQTPPLSIVWAGSNKLPVLDPRTTSEIVADAAHVPGMPGATTEHERRRFLLYAGVARILAKTEVKRLSAQFAAKQATAAVTARPVSWISGSVKGS